MNKIKKFVEWLKNPCTRGRHDMVVIKRGRCKAHMRSVFVYMGQVDCEVEVRACRKCLKREAEITDGTIRQKMPDPDYILRQLGGVNT